MIHFVPGTAIHYSYSLLLIATHHYTFCYSKSTHSFLRYSLESFLIFNVLSHLIFLTLFSLTKEWWRSWWISFVNFILFTIRLSSNDLTSNDFGYLFSCWANIVQYHFQIEHNPVLSFISSLLSKYYSFNIYLLP